VIQFFTGRSSQCAAGLLLPVLCFCLSSCSPEIRLPDGAVKTTKAGGQVTLDGNPGWGIVVTLHPKSGGEAAAILKW